MKDMPKATEQKIVEALEKAVKMANDGTTPDDALVKVANDYEFPAEIVKRMVEAYNVSKTLSHLKHANHDSRADSFPIASIENILGQLFPAEPDTPAKQAAAELHPFYETGADINFMELSKEAKVTELPPMTEKKADPYDRDPEALAKEAIQNYRKLAQFEKKALDAYRHVYLRFFETLDKTANYWRTTTPKEPFDLVEKRAVATYGTLAKIAMDMVYEQGNLGQAKLHVKRADADELGTQQMHFDDSVTPYREVAQLCFMSKQIDRFLKEAAAVGQVKHQYAMLNHDVLPPQPVMAAIEWGLAKGAEAFLEQDRPAKTKEIYKALKRDHPDWPAGKKARIAEAANNKYEENKDKKDDDDDEKNGHALDDLFEKGAQGSIFDIPVPNAPKLNPKMQGAMDEARATLKSLPAHAAPSTGSFGAFNRARLANAADPAQRRAGQKLNRAIPRMANEEATSFGPTPGKPGSPAGGTQPKSNLKDYT